MCTAPRIVYQQGDHVCTLYSTPEEQLAAAIEYIRAGLGRGERCLYVCGEHAFKDFCRALDAAGIDVKREKARGALLLVAKHEAHLKGGTFDPSAMIDLLNTAVKEALDQGAAVLDHCLATHPYVRIDGPLLLSNPFYELPEAAVTRTPRIEGLDARVNSFQPQRS